MEESLSDESQVRVLPKEGRRRRLAVRRLSQPARTPAMDRHSEKMVRSTLGLGSLILLLASPVSAADFVVTRYDDPVPNGCLATDCSLREAVIAAVGGANRVVLSAGTYQLTIVDTGGPGSNSGGLRVNGTLEIVGLGADLTRIDGTGVSETILIGEGGQLNLTVRGIRFQNSDEHGVMFLDGAALVEDCAFVDNGGAIFLGGGLVANNAMESLDLRRSTIAGNTGDGLSVGAAAATIENITSTGNGLLELRTNSSVFSCNHCTLARGSGTGDVLRVGFTTAILSNSIVAGNCSFATNGAIDSAGGNVESAGNSCQFDQASDLTGVASEDLALGDLADNGGPTPTMAPAAGSIVLGAALDALCAAEDQRGVIRDTDCESGAFEATDAPVPPRLFADGFEQGNPGAWSEVAP